MFCSKCGKTLKPEASNCPFCGAVVGDSRFEGNGYTSAQPRFSSVPGEEVRPVMPYTRTTYTSMQEEGEAPNDDVYTRTTYRPLLEDAEDDIMEQIDEPQQHFESQPQSAQSTLPVYGDEFDDDEVFEQEEPEDMQDDDAIRGLETGVDEQEQEEEEEDEIPAPAQKTSASVSQQTTAQPSMQFAQSSHRRYTPDANIPGDGITSGGIVIAPPAPIKKTGISPEVQQYMQRMSEQRPPKKSIKQLLGRVTGADADEQQVDENIPVGEESQEGQGISADAITETDAGTSAPRRLQQTRPQAITRQLPSWLKPLAITLCILIILGAAGYALILRFANEPPIKGVTYELYEQGIKLIKEHAQSPYRTELVKLVQADPTTATLVKKLDTDKAQLQALMPANPLENDKLFVDTLVSIQSAIEKAAGEEALAVIARGSDSSSTEIEDRAKATWSEVENSITRLERVTEARELQGIQGDAVLVLATPEPSVEPTPSPYKTLKNGMKNSAAVKRMQKRLTELGFFRSQTDGDFGPVTVQAVKQFKQVAGITPVDGIADIAMQEALFADDAPRASGKATPKPTTTPVPVAGAAANAATDTDVADIDAPEDDEPVVAD